MLLISAIGLSITLIVNYRQIIHLIMQPLRTYAPFVNGFASLTPIPSSMAPLILRLLINARRVTVFLTTRGEFFTSLGICLPTKPLPKTFLNIQYI